MSSNVIKEKNDYVPELTNDSGCQVGKRHIQVILYAISMYAVISISSCTNIAILEMTDTNSTNNNTKFDWNKKIIGYVASSQYWGDIVVQLCVGPIMHKFGGKHFMTLSLGGTAVVQLLLPTLVRLADWKGMCFGGLFYGIFGGLYYPAFQTLLGKWAPVNERTRMGMFSYIGMNMAFIITLPLSGYIATTLGWKGVFYTYGCQNLVCCVLWIIFGANSPSEHKSITQEEKKLIFNSLDQTEDSKPQSTPWKAIFTSVPYLAIVFAQVGALWSFFVITYEFPSLYKNGVGTNVPESGLYSSFGYILAIITGFIASWSCDYLLMKKYFNLTQLRMIYNTIGTWGPALFIVIVAYIPIEYIKTIILLTSLIVGFDSINVCGYVMSFVDLSPNYCGMLYSISIVISDLVCLLAPIFDGYILQDDITNILKWRIVLLMAAATYFFGNVIFLIFGTAERQPWDNADNKDKKMKDVELNGATEKMLNS